MNKRNKVARSYRSHHKEHLWRLLELIKNIAGALVALVGAWQALRSFQRAEAFVTVTYLEQAALIMFVGITSLLALTEKTSRITRRSTRIRAKASRTG